MALPRINGTLQPVRTKLSTRFDPVRGIVVTEEYESAGNHLSGLALAAKNAGMDYSLDANDRLSRLIITTTGAAAGFPEEATSVWQLYTQEFQKDIREHPNSLALSRADLAQINLLVNQFKEGESATPDFSGLENPPDAEALYFLITRGVTSYEITGFVARATISLPFLYSEAIPGVAPDSLMAALIDDIPVGGPDDANFTWGWRRKGTSRTFSGNNRTEINHEWWLASWANFLYDDVTDLPS